MSPENRQAEYNLMMNSPRRPLKVQIPKGPLLELTDTWDYTVTLHKVQFKTTNSIKAENPFLKVEKLDMSPFSYKKCWIVTITKIEDSNLKTNKK